MQHNTSIQSRLIAMNFLEFAVWGAYLISMGSFLAKLGIGADIGWFYSVQGIVSIFMPALVGIIADRWIPAQRMLSLCHLVAAGGMLMVGVLSLQGATTFAQLFPWYTLSVAAYMPTLALTNSVSYNALDRAGLDTVKAFPPIRIFGTIGFIISMWLVDLMGWQHTETQFFVSATWSLLLAAYALTLPNCPVSKGGTAKGLVQALGLDAFRLFAQKRMALFFIFSMLLGVSLQITNAYANSFISSFAVVEQFSGEYFVEHANLLISLSQISETFCILLIPFFLKRFGIKTVMLIAMFAWVLRFGFFAFGNPAFPGVTLFILSMLVYGVAFDFFNVSGSLFVDKETEPGIRSSAQGLFMLMTNGIGASVGTLSAQAVVNRFVTNDASGHMVGDWQTVWLIFAAYALVVAMTFMVVFKERKAQ